MFLLITGFRFVKHFTYQVITFETNVRTLIWKKAYYLVQKVAAIVVSINYLNLLFKAVTQIPVAKPTWLPMLSYLVIKIETRNVLKKARASSTNKI